MEMEKYKVQVLLRHWKQNYKATAAAKKKKKNVMLKAKVL
jgi:hypothetical protein